MKKFFGKDNGIPPQTGEHTFDVVNGVMEHRFNGEIRAYVDLSMVEDYALEYPACAGMVEPVFAGANDPVILPPETLGAGMDNQAVINATMAQQ